MRCCDDDEKFRSLLVLLQVFLAFLVLRKFSFSGVVDFVKTPEIAALKHPCFEKSWLCFYM